MPVTEDGEPTTATAESITASAADVNARFAWIGLALLLAALAFRLIGIAFRTPLGTDELMARVSAQSPSLLQVLTLLRAQPVNVDAPVFPVLGYLAAHLPLPIDLAIRIPSMIAMLVAVAAVFSLVRRHLNSVSGFVAAGVLATSGYATMYGAAARPYAFLLAFVLVAALCRQHAVSGDSRRRAFWLVSLAVSSTLAFWTHYFAALCFLGMFAADAHRCWRGRRIDRGIWAAYGFAFLCSLPVYWMLLPGAQPYRAHPFDELRIAELAQTYADAINLEFALCVSLIPLIVGLSGKLLLRFTAGGWRNRATTVTFAGAPLLFAVGVYFTRTHAERYGNAGVMFAILWLTATLVFPLSVWSAAGKRGDPLLPQEVDYWFLTAGFALVPIPLYAAGVLYTNTYAIRYGIVAAGGVAMWMGAFVRLSTRVLTALASGFVLLVAVFRLVMPPDALHGPQRNEEALVTANPAALRGYDDLPLVMSDFDHWMRVKFYAPAWFSSRVVMVTSPDVMRRFGRSENLALAALAIHRWTGWPLESYESFTREHRRFLLCTLFVVDSQLKADGARIKPVEQLGGYPLVLVQLPEPRSANSR